MILNINEEITSATLDKFIAFCNISGEKQKIIYLNTIGGDCDVAEAIIDIINSDFNSFIFLGYGTLYSVGFELFFRVQCEKHLIGGVRGMYHQSSMQIQYSENNRPKNAEDKINHEFMFGYMRNQSIEICDMLKFTIAEKKAFNAGKELWFGAERMNKFIEICQ